MDKDVNQILLNNLIKRVILPLNDIVEWDRYGLRENNGFIFGWIKRDDGFYDFVSVNFEITSTQFLSNFNTSSKKYSKIIAERLSQDSDVLDPYLDCKPASDIAEAKIVKWQKTVKPILAIYIISILFSTIAFSAMFGGGTNPNLLTGKPHKAGRQSYLVIATSHAGNAQSNWFGDVEDYAEGAAQSIATQSFSIAHNLLT